MQSCDFASEVIAGKENVVADSLSRIAWPHTFPNTEMSDDHEALLVEDSESVAKLKVRLP